MRVIQRFTGELGLELYYRVPQVHTICQREPCVVEITQGKEALYPAAAEWRVVGSDEDHVSRGGRGRPDDLGVEPSRFVPEPHEPHDWQDPDVVVCPRRMDYGGLKNWDGWADLTRNLMASGADVVAAGAPGSSAPVHCPKAWVCARPLDASIAAMRQARLVIATDSGLAHLAVLCGAPLLVVTYRGLVAPGPVIDSSGRKARASYQRAGFDPQGRINRFEAANHTGSPIEYVDGWEDPTRVVEAARDMVARAAVVSRVRRGPRD